jgi:hypothetical protein
LSGLEAIFGSSGYMIFYGYSTTRYKFVLEVQIRTGYASNCGRQNTTTNVIWGKVSLQIVWRTSGIFIFIMIPSDGNDIIIRAPPVGPYRLIVVFCDVCFC